MKKVIAFGASNSKLSINQQFAHWAANQLDDVEVEVLDLNQFEMPIYSIDRENETGIPQKAMDFKAKINEADALVISFAEHNGSYTAAFKNVSDWVSRVERGTWGNKPTLLLSTSPGPRGGLSTLESATTALPYQGAHVAGSFALPSFGQKFSENEGIVDTELKQKFNEQLNNLKEVLNGTQVETAAAGA